MTAAERVLRGNLLHTGRSTLVTIDDSIITAVEDLGAASTDDPWLAPGLVDLQINGCVGQDFNLVADDPQVLSVAADHLLSRGVTTFLPTLVSNSDEHLSRSLAAITRAVHDLPAVSSRVGGINLEGPFISPVDGPRGAHDARWIRPPDWPLFRRWQEAADGRIRIVTVSPEWPQATAFIERCVDAGVIVAIGHTAASPAQIRTAIRAGATLATHLGNGTHLNMPRHDNYVWEQLAADELWATFIADGAHLPDAMLKVMLRAKDGRAVLVSDAVSIAGLPPGSYETIVGGKVVLSADGRLSLASNPELLAGSTMLMPDAVMHVVESGLASLAEAWQMASTLPASLVGLPGAAGIAPGAPADLVVMRIDDGRIDLESVLKAGHELAREPVRA